MAAQPPDDPGMQHQTPPIFYCWKYWLSTGEVAQGCTAVDVMGNQQSSMPDLNMYGWMYIVVPLAALMLLLLLLYCCCGGKSSPPPPKHKVLLEDV